LQSGTNKCEEVFKELEFNSTTIQDQINQLFNKLGTILDEKKQELLNQLDDILKSRKKEFELQKDELKFGIESIIGCCQIIENALSSSTKNDVRLLSMKESYHSRLNYLLTNKWKIEPSHHSFIQFQSFEIEIQSIYSSISNIGAINANDISADKCLISSFERQLIVGNAKLNFEIISYSKDGKRIKNGGSGNNFTIQIEEESKNDNEINEINEWEIIDGNNGKYEVKINLKSTGKYSIFVKYNGMNLPSSPFQIQVFPKTRNYHEMKEPKFTFGSLGNGNGQFNSPRGVTDSNGNILVTDTNNHRIQIFDSEGKFISTFGSNGNGNGQFSNPWGIAMNSKGNILVGEYSGNRIQIFNSEGEFLSMFGQGEIKNVQFHDPKGISIDKNDNIYISDASRIQIFNSEGKFISTFGERGVGNCQFNYPIGITINSKGNIHVCDNNNHRIQIFDSKGNFISTFGSNGNGNSQFDGPWGISVDIDDNIFVCDYGNNRIQVFNSNGAYITQFKVNQPLDITIDPNTQNIIVSRNDSKVSIF